MPERPLIAILPGIDGLSLLSDPLIEVADERYDFLQICYPVEEDGDWSIDDYVAYVEERLPDDRQILLFAISFSGPVALRLLTRKGHRYVGAIFCTTFAKAPQPFLLQLTRFFPVEQILEWSRQDALLRTMFLLPKSPEEHLRVLKETGEQVPSSTLAHRLEVVRGIDDTGLLDEITVPCCAIRARRDLLVPPGAIRPFHEHLKDFEAHDIRGPHALILSAPEECWTITRHFIDRLTTP